MLSVRVRGIAWLLASIGFFTCSMTIVRGIGTDLPIAVMVLFRALFGVSVMLPWLYRKGFGVLRTRRWGLYWLRALFAVSNLYVMFTALTLMPVADVTAVLFTRPMITTALAIVILGEVAGRRLWLALTIGFAGAVILIRPGFEAVNIGALFALAAAALTSLAYNVAKLLTRTESPDTIAFYQTLLMVPLIAIPAILVWQTPTWEQLGLLFAVGGLATLSHRAMNRAYALQNLTLLQPLEFIRLPLGALLGLMAFSEWPDAWVWIGGAVIFAASIYGTRAGAAVKRGTE